LPTGASPAAPKAAYFSRAFVFREKGDFSQALADYNRVIALDPRYADAWAMRGLLNLRMDQESEAQADFVQFLRLKPAGNVSLENLVRLERLQLASRP
jgi:Flp pilus assembly protein TadD